MSTNRLVTIVDYGTGNLRSIVKVFERLDITWRVSSEGRDLLEASHLILPGVGHFGTAASNIARRGLIPYLNESRFERNVPILGICLGMHLLGDGSEEGDGRGLGWIKGMVRKISPTQCAKFRLPHLGWNSIEPKYPQHNLFNDIPAGSELYFVHTYCFHPENDMNVLAESSYGISFPSVIGKGKLFGVQFHPEKSGAVGEKIIKNFMSY